MTLGRRRALLCVTFFGLALLFASGPARAQDNNPSHAIWGPKALSLDQLAAALGGGSGLSWGQLDQATRDKVIDLMRSFEPQATRDEIAKSIQAIENGKDQKQREELRRLIQQLKDNAAVLKAIDPKTAPNILKGMGGDPSKFLDPKNQTPPAKGGPPQMPPEVGKNPDPRTNPNLIKPPEPKQVEPPDNNTPAPPQAANRPPPSLPSNPFDPPGSNKSMEAFAEMWTRVIGPLEKTPEVQRALFDLMSGENGLNFDVKDDQGNSLWDMLKSSDGSGRSLNDLLSAPDVDMSGGGGWDWPKVNFPSWGKWFGSGGSSWSSSGSSSTPGSPPGSFGGSGGGFDGLGKAWVPLVIVALVILAIMLWIRLKHLRDPDAHLALAGDGLGRWPVDPRAIESRQDVVLAFEYLSVLICGDSARVWTHGTIAGALTELAATHDERAVMLARLYELARYAPLDEPLSRDEVIEARHLVCDLVGVSY